jgi:hypothetical protein
MDSQTAADELHSLQQLIRPPLVAIGALGDWGAVQTTLGPLPPGYEEFIRVYGVGCVDSFLWIFSPFATNPHLNLFAQQNLFRSSMGELSNQFEAFKAPNFPDCNELLCLGVTDNGDSLCWRQSPSAVQCGFVFIESRAPETFGVAAPCSFPALLTSLLTRKINCTHWPRSFPSGRPMFVQ